MTRILSTSWAQLSTPVDLGVDARRQPAAGLPRAPSTATPPTSSPTRASTPPSPPTAAAPGSCPARCSPRATATAAAHHRLHARRHPDQRATATPAASTGTSAPSPRPRCRPRPCRSSPTTTPTVRPWSASGCGGLRRLPDDPRCDGIYARQVWPDPRRGGQGPRRVHQPGPAHGRGGPARRRRWWRRTRSTTNVVLWDVLRQPASTGCAGMDGRQQRLRWPCCRTVTCGWPRSRADRLRRRASRASRRAAGPSTGSPTLLDDLVQRRFGLEVSSAGALRAEMLLTGNDAGDPSRVHARSARPRWR